MSVDAAPDAQSVTPEPTAEGAGEWVPEFEGQRPPFLPGNEAAVTHGARSPRKVERVARQVSEELAERFPIALDYPETLNALARVEGVARMLFADLVTNTAYGKKGEFRAALLSRWNAAENTAAKLRASLGMTPQSEAQVARDRAVAASATVDVLGELAKRGAATRAITTDTDREDA